MFTVATSELLQAHVPPLIPFDNVVVSPWQTPDMPVVVVGAIFTVTIAVVGQYAARLL